MRRALFGFKNAVLRCLVIPGFALLLVLGSAMAQSSGARAQDQPKPAANAPVTPADAAKESQRKADEFVEASTAINGPAGNPECVWLGRRVVVLMWRDDLDTAFRHLDLYDRFGCPGGHVQATFRCLVKFGPTIDAKVPDSLNRSVQACWINPGALPQTASAVLPAAAPAASAPPAPPSPTPPAEPAK
ncbi:hypothetical protein BH11PSE4_BH11PSE4_11760 [soil metagenome]